MCETTPASLDAGAEESGPLLVAVVMHRAGQEDRQGERCCYTCVTSWPTRRLPASLAPRPFAPPPDASLGATALTQTPLRASPVACEIARRRQRAIARRRAVVEKRRRGTTVPIDGSDGGHGPQRDATAPWSPVCLKAQDNLGQSRIIWDNPR